MKDGCLPSKWVLFSRAGEALDAYLEELRRLGLAVDVVSSAEELGARMRQQAYHGLLVDMITKMKLPKSDLADLQEVLAVFPTVQLRWDKKNGKVGFLCKGVVGASFAIGEFFAQQHQLFPARKVRGARRRRAFYNVLLAGRPTAPPEEWEKTATLNISAGGCFIFTSHDWQEGDEVWLKIRELSDQDPIRALVCWRLAWGQAMRLPGIGVSFSDIKEGQLAELLS